MGQDPQGVQNPGGLHVCPYPCKTSVTDCTLTAAAGT